MEQNNDTKSLRKADFIMSLLLIAASVFFFIHSLKLMQRTVGKGDEWYISAGLVPMLICALLMVCAVILLVNAIKSGIFFSTNVTAIKAKIKSRSFLVTAFIIAWFAVYIFLLLDWMSYWLATLIFLVGFMIVFSGRDIKKIIIGIVVSVLTVLLITYCFGSLVGIPLP